MFNTLLLWPSEISTTSENEATFALQTTNFIQFYAKTKPSTKNQKSQFEGCKSHEYLVNEKNTLISHLTKLLITKFNN